MLYATAMGEIKRFDKVIAKINWCNFLTHSVHDVSILDKLLHNTQAQ